jgi:small acid-soluble spore protein F (minor alpha/beta-type SASP)
MKDNKNTVQRKTKPDWNKLTKEDLQKLEIAEEIGVIDKIYAGGYGNLTSKESGKIGGILAARNKAEKKKKTIVEPRS